MSYTPILILKQIFNEMKIDFRIPVFEVQNNSLVKTHDKIYVINFLPGSSYNRVRLVVDGKIAMTKELNVLDYNKSKKDLILAAIQYVSETDKPLNYPNPRKFLTIEKCKQMFAKIIVNAFQKNVLNIQTEQHRDVLEKYNLIFIENEHSNLKRI